MCRSTASIPRSHTPTASTGRPTPSVCYVDGTLVDSEPVAIAADMRPLVSDFNADGSGVAVDWMTGDAYAASGAFLSRVLDAGDARAAWGSLAAQGDAGVAFATRTGDTATPDASWSDFQDVGPAGEIVSPRGRYLQYRATLTTADTSTTPTLDRVDASFDVDTIAPGVNIDGVDISGANAAVRFSSPDSDVARFECKLDDGAYATCSQPEAAHGARRRRAHHRRPRHRRRRQHRRRSDERLHRRHHRAARTISRTTSRSTGTAATVTFSSPDSDVARFECKLDDGAYDHLQQPEAAHGARRRRAHHHRPRHRRRRQHRRRSRRATSPSTPPRPPPASTAST